MSWRVHVLASPAMATGFRLAGLSAEGVANPRDTAERLTASAGQADLGILLVE